MRIPRIFVDSRLAADSEQVLPVAASRHLLQVLRLRAGSELCVFDGHGGEFPATLLAADQSVLPAALRHFTTVVTAGSSFLVQVIAQVPSSPAVQLVPMTGRFCGGV